VLAAFNNFFRTKKVSAEQQDTVVITIFITCKIPLVHRAFCFSARAVMSARIEILCKNFNTGMFFEKLKVLNRVLIAKGKFGSCYKCTTRSGQTVALKVQTREHANADWEDRIHREIDIHRQLQHPNVCTMWQHWFRANAVYICLEYCDQSVMQRVQTCSPELSWVKCTMRDIVQGLTYIHGANIIHRDIKLHNLLLCGNDKAKITDFGLATWGPIATGLAGTPNYLACEVAERQPYGFAVDVWSLGCCLVAMLLQGKCPFSSGTVAETIENIRQRRFTTVLPEACSSFLQSHVFVGPSERCGLLDMDAWCLS